MNNLKMCNFSNMSVFVLLFSLWSSGGTTLYGQKSSPVSWIFELKKINTSEYEIIATASIKKVWLLYSQFTDDTGPVPTQFVLEDEVVTFEEKSKSLKEFDPMFDVDVIKFKEMAVFSKKVHRSEKKNISGYVTYMTCDGAKCLPPADVNFNLNY